LGSKIVIYSIFSGGLLAGLKGKFNAKIAGENINKNNKLKRNIFLNFI
jgi:hypothetical protein